MNRISRAIVLAAGLGSRLNGDVPKPVRAVSGVPLLVRVLRTLEDGFGISHHLKKAARARPINQIWR